MSKKDIYQILRGGGFSRAGALAMMGNIGAESAFISNIVESRCPMSNLDYTHNVNIGIISKYDFCHDSYGYGLCQWTLPYRKDKLYDFAYMANESIGDEFMQTKFILREFQTESEYAALYQYLCTTNDMYEATKRICMQYERPAVNNIDARYQIACQCANEPYDDEDAEPEKPPEYDDSVESCEIEVRVLKPGYMGRDVFIAQCALNDMDINCGKPDGDFGELTEKAVKDLQRTCNLDVTGIIGKDEWQIICQ